VKATNCSTLDQMKLVRENLISIAK